MPSIFTEQILGALVNTLPIEQWRSKTESGLLQELYV